MARAVPVAGLRPVFQFPVAALGSAVTWPTALFLTLTSPRSGPPRLSSPQPGPPPRSAQPERQTEPETEAVTAALASLQREQRQVLMCTFYGRLSADDAAARLGMPVRDVKRHARAALTEIRRVLTEQGVPIPRQSALPA